VGVREGFRLVRCVLVGTPVLEIADLRIWVAN
jgi:hypothetical protein